MKKPAGLMCPPLTLPETRIPIITPRPPDKHPGRNKFINFNDFIFYSGEINHAKFPRYLKIWA